MTVAVRTERDGNVLVMIIDNPPINAGSLDVRAGLLRAIGELHADASLIAGVIMGAGNTFIAGSDLREFSRPLEDPQLPGVIVAIEQCAKPVVAALHGAALGGGFELALGCDARIAQRDAIIGLPEVTLGMIPGAGGTQRVPRLVGVPRAISFICTGERLAAEKALALGLIDHIVDGGLRDAAVTLARRLEGQKCLVRAIQPPSSTADERVLAAANALRKGRNRAPVAAAVEAIQWSESLPIDDALQRERVIFQQLRTGADASALRHLFFAEREAAKQPEAPQTLALPVDVVAVIGAGTMGTGIAIALLDAGYEVRLIEQDAAALARGEKRIQDHYAEKWPNDPKGLEPVDHHLARFLPTLDWAALTAADVIIEAVFEDISVKKAVFAQIDALAKPGALLASNTSYLDIDAIAAVTHRPQDVVGLHFFGPANVMKLLEIVRGAHTANHVVATMLLLAKRMRKVPVVTANAFGFVGNRIYAAYRKQCEFMIEEGALPQQVDAALRGFGFAMGPFAVADLSGLDIAWRMRKAQATSRSADQRYVAIADALCELGRFGRKTGAGYYLYDASSPHGRPDPTVQAIIERLSASKGVVRRTLEDSEICKRALLAMVNEAALLVAEKVAGKISDVDVVLANGYGFPRWEGGPVYWAKQQDLDVLERDLVWLAEVSGVGFVKGDLAVLVD